MKDIINTLITNKYDVTIVAGEEKPVQFYLGVIFDDLTDLWYLSQLCKNEDLDVGYPYFKENVIYFPRLVVGDEEYRIILGALQ